MLNRRKLIQNVLADLRTERSYFDFKQKLDLNSEAGKGKLIRAVAALANTNQDVPSFVIVGIEDGTRRVVGAPDLDDARLQQLIRNYIQPQLNLLYEVVPFPQSGSRTSVGLLTINPTQAEVSILRNIWKLRSGDRFVRSGSETRKLESNEIVGANAYAAECRSLIARSSVSLTSTLDELLAFYRNTTAEYNPAHVVFNDNHVVCYSGYKDERFSGMHSEVRVELLTEGLSLIWSAMKFAEISVRASEFEVREHALLAWEGNGQLYPLERTALKFSTRGTYHVEKSVIFRPPKVSAAAIAKLLLDHDAYVSRGQHPERGETFPGELLIAALNGSEDALSRLTSCRSDGAMAEAQRDAMNVLRIFKGTSEPGSY